MAIPKTKENDGNEAAIEELLRQAVEPMQRTYEGLP